MRPLFFALLVACSGSSESATPDEADPTPTPSEPEAPAEAAEPAARTPGPIDPSWVGPRVAEARTRMQSSPAGQLVWDAIEAHGGLEAWLTAGVIQFDFDYQPVANPARRMKTHNDIDLWSARGRQNELAAEDPSNAPLATMGWNGEEAWITPNAAAFPSTARFWTLTPFYFTGMPFVAADPGTQYEQLEDATLDGVEHHLVRLTYEAGTGDSPEDYYILYLHPETHRLSALRYVVAYPGFFPEGGHTPEKLMRYADLQAVSFGNSALQFATHLNTSAWDSEAGEVGDVVTEIAVSNIALGGALPVDHFDPVEGAERSRTIEARPR